MNILNFNDLLKAARAQSEPQLLLFVFAKAEPNDEMTPSQQAAFEHGQGGVLVPKICVDKRAEDLVSFDSLVKESKETEQAWDVIFISSLTLQGGLEPSSERVDEALNNMVQAIHSGMINNFLVLDKQGETLSLY